MRCQNTVAMQGLHILRHGCQCVGIQNAGAARGEQHGQQVRSPLHPAAGAKAKGSDALIFQNRSQYLGIVDGAAHQGVGLACV